MNLLDYLKAKYDTDTPNCILKGEAKIIGVAYPLKSQWLDKFGEIELTGHMIFCLKDFHLKHPTNLHVGRALAIIDVLILEIEVDRIDNIKKENDNIIKIYGSQKAFNDFKRFEQRKIPLWKQYK